MNIFNKYEAMGISLSVVLMVVVLGLVKFNSGESLVDTDDLSGTQGAQVAVSQNEPVVQKDIESDLKKAFTANGTLVELVIDDVRFGDGVSVQKGDTVHVHYIGTTQDGIRFDNSYERGEPFVFTVGDGKVIEGWEKGLLGMKVGGQRILVIPSSMAYGNRQVGPIPPNSPLVFTIELIAIE